MFAEVVAEAFQSMANITWDVRSYEPGVVTAHFSAGEISVEVRFEERGGWIVSFEVLRDPSAQAIYVAFHIFNGVFQAVEEFISTREPAVLVFATKREELADIYDLYLRREQEKLAELGYRLEPVANIAPFREYRLRRVKPSEWK